MSEHKHNWLRFGSTSAPYNFGGPYFEVRWCVCGVSQQRYPGKGWKTLEAVHTPVIQLEARQ